MGGSWLNIKVGNFWSAMDLGNRLCVRAEVKKLLLHRDTCPRQRPMISGKQGADAQARLFASTCPTGFFAALLPQGDAQRKRQVYAREELRAAIASLILGSELGLATIRSVMLAMSIIALGSVRQKRVPPMSARRGLKR